MRRWIALGGAVLSSSVALASWAPDAAPAARGTRPPEVERRAGRVAAAVSAQKEELAALRKQALRDQAEALYSEALSLGIARAVEQSRMTARQQKRISQAILREARRHGVDPMLVIAVIRAESSFNNYAVSPVGAMGLMQVMPATGRYLLEKQGRRLHRDRNLFDPELNIELGTGYLADLIRRFGSVEHALVAYNAGPGNARKILSRRDVRRRFIAGYPRKVVTEFRRLKLDQAKLAAAQSGPEGPPKS